MQHSFALENVLTSVGIYFYINIMLNALLNRFTLTQLWIFATSLSVLPLLGALSYAAYALRQQTIDQRALMEALDNLNTLEAEISEEVTDMVRLSRQFMLLGEESFLELYRQKQKGMSNNSQRLLETLTTTATQQSPAPTENLKEMVPTLIESASSLEQQLSQHPQQDQAIAGLINQMRQLSNQLASGLDDYVRTSVKTGEEHFSQVADRLILICTLTLPIALLLVVLSTLMASRPIRRLNRAISQLGLQQWNTPIAIIGPADLQALGKNLEWMRQQICAADMQKRAFIQHVTHELKTPLAAIIEAGNLLHDETIAPLNTGQKPVLEIQLNSARNLQALIQQLLNYNSVSHGLIPSYQPLDIAELCQRICQNLTAADSKKVAWKIEGQPRLVQCDALAMEMILSNLLSNAYHYIGDGGEVSVHWQMDQTSWQLTVSDKGPGIDSNELPLIFKPFYKGSAGRRDTIPRSGIGLAIVKACIENLNARIFVSSTPGEGTTFTMTFPRDLQQPNPDHENSQHATIQNP